MQITEQVFLKIFFGDKEISINDFESLVIIQEAGLIVPTFEMQLKQMDYSWYKLLKNNTPIEIIVGKDIDTAEKHKFIIIDYNYFENNNGLNLLLSGLLDVVEFTKKPKIRAFEGNTSEVAASIDTVKMNIDYKGNDKQVWIQHNITDKKFLENIVDHSYISDDDFVMSAININKEVTLRSAKKAVTNNKKNIINFSTNQTSESDVFEMDSFEIGSESGVWSYQLSDNRTQPVLAINDRNISVLDFNTKSIKNNKSYNENISGVQFPTRFDMGNCHDKFNFAKINNLNKAVLFFRNKVITGSSQYFFQTNKLKLLDTINFMVEDSDDNLNNTTEVLSGNYILSKITMSFTSSKGFYQQFEMYRDYELDI